MIIKHPEEYKSGSRVMLLRGRYKDGLDNQRRIIRISHYPEEFDKNFVELCAIRWIGERIYASVSPRCVRKASKILKSAMVDAEYEGFTEHFFERLETRWASALASKNSIIREENLWLIDIDTSEEREIISKDKLDVVYQYSTKNGEHWIVRPTNRSVLSDLTNQKLDMNALMLWAY